MNRHYSENLPLPLFAKEGNYSSLWKREVRRDFSNQCLQSFEAINKAEPKVRRTKRPLGATILALFLLLFSLPPSVSQAAEGKPIDSKGPVVITSSSLTADNKNRTALFEGSVVAKTDTMTIHSDRMLVYYSEGGNITKIDASGHVKLIRGERVVTSEAAAYFAEDEKVIFTGEPRAVERGSIVSGTRMIYLMKEDRSIVENSKVSIEGRKGK